ncbi:hypothetical protein AB3S75_021339 [Citrus x aurantiifolia]
MADEQNPSDALPNGWIAVIEEGDTVKVDCNQPVEVRCTRCWCTGHTAPECTCSDRLVKIHNEMLFGRANEKVRKCKRCGRGGHNIRNCHGPIFKS